MTGAPHGSPVWLSGHSYWGNAARLGFESIGNAMLPMDTPSRVRADSATESALVSILTRTESVAASVSTSTVSAPPAAVMMIDTRE